MSLDFVSTPNANIWLPPTRHEVLGELFGPIRNTRLKIERGGGHVPACSSITNIFNQVSPIAPMLLVDKPPRLVPVNARKAGSEEVANLGTLPPISRPLGKTGKFRATHFTQTTAPGLRQTTLAILGGISPAKLFQILLPPAGLPSTAEDILSFFVKSRHCHNPLVEWTSSELYSSNASKKAMSI